MITIWSDERVERIVQLWGDGRSASAIAALIGGTTRNAVLGKLHRLGLTQKRTPHRASLETRIRRKAKRTKTAPTVKRTDILRELPTEPLPPEDTPPSSLIAFDDLEPHHCRWVYGDPRRGDHGFCGQHHVEGLAYCAGHARKAYVVPEVKARFVERMPVKARVMEDA